MSKRNKHYIQSIIKNSDITLIEGFLFLSIFILSLIVGSKYVGGDQKYYRIVYNQLRNYNLFKGYLYYSLSLDSFEVVHFLIDWIFCRILPKDLVMSVFNALLGVILYRLLRKWGADRFNAFFIALTNYYMLVLYFAAERLKFGFLLFGIGLLSNDKKIKELFCSLSIFGHIQMAILFLAMKVETYFKALIKIFSRLRISKSILIGIIIIIGIVIIMSTQIITKLAYYAFQNIKITDIAKTMVFFFGSFVFSRNKQKVVYMYLPIIVATFIVGSFRTNIFAYFLMLYFCISNKKGYNLVIYSTNIYYSIMSISFLSQIFKYGSAFLSN